MTITRWNPVRDMIQMRDAMDQVDRMFNETFRTRGASVWQLPMDAHVTNDAIVLQANVPGLRPEDLQVTIEGDTVTIRGEFKSEQEDAKYLLRERTVGKFERTLTINTPIDATKVSAEFENGVLTLTMPKAEAVKPRQIEIKPRTVQSQS